MSVYGYSISKGKTAFNIHLSSYQVNSWTGSLYNATYYVDPRGHLDVSDFKKEYNVYLSIESEAVTDNTINPLSTYACHLDIGSSTANVATFRDRIMPMFIVYKDTFNNAVSALYTRFKVGSQDNPAIRINSLFGLDHVGINIFDINGQATCTSTANFQVILRFEEV